MYVSSFKSSMMCCSVLQCGILQCVGNMMQSSFDLCSILVGLLVSYYVSLLVRVLQCVSVCFSVLQCVAVFCVCMCHTYRCS